MSEDEKKNDGKVTLKRIETPATPQVQMGFQAQPQMYAQPIPPQVVYGQVQPPVQTVQVPKGYELVKKEAPDPKKDVTLNDVVKELEEFDKKADQIDKLMSRRTPKTNPFNDFANTQMGLGIGQGVGALAMRAPEFVEKFFEKKEQKAASKPPAQQQPSLPQPPANSDLTTYINQQNQFNQQVVDGLKKLEAELTKVAQAAATPAPIEPKPKKPTKHCPNCNHELPIDYLACPACGRSFIAVETPATTEAGERLEYERLMAKSRKELDDMADAEGLDCTAYSNKAEAVMAILKQKGLIKDGN